MISEKKTFDAETKKSIFLFGRVSQTVKKATYSTSTMFTPNGPGLPTKSVY